MSHPVSDPPPGHSALPELGPVPAVSYIMPVLNEERFLERAVTTILDQDYAGVKEIVLALGPSRDRSSEIAKRLAEGDSRVRIVDNPARDIPAGLNLAIAASKHPVVIRVDAHSELTPDYTSRGVAVLRETGAANVGGVMRAAGSTPVQQAIARGYNSPYGLGGGAYHGEGTPGPAESAYLGIFRREALDTVGGYDTGILRGEDWELNLRMRRAGFTVWFEPKLGVTYWPRASFGDLAKQFFATGTWRAVLVRKYGGANPVRFFAPGVLVIGLAVSFLVLVLQLTAVLPWGWWSLGWSPLALYALAIVFATARIPEQHSFADRLRTARTLVTMHTSWGLGFLRGIIFGGGKLFGKGKILDRSRA